MSLILQQVQSLCRQHRDTQSCHDSGYPLIDLGIQLITSSDQYQGVFLFPFDPFQDIPCFLAQTRLIATLCLLCCRRGAPQSMRCHLRKILPHEGKQRLMVTKRDLRVIEWNADCRNLLLHLLCQYIPIGCMCSFINIRLFFPPAYHRHPDTIGLTLFQKVHQMSVGQPARIAVNPMRHGHGTLSK